MDGGSGNDTLIVSGTAGNDTLGVIYNGGFTLSNVANGTLTNVEDMRIDLLGGVNTLSFAGSTVSIAVDLLAGFGSGIVVLNNVANATGGSGADVLSGNDGNNILNGGAGDDQLTGLLGNDTLVGGSGSDILFCGIEADAMFIDLAAGTLRRGSAAAAVEDSLSSIENAVGSNFNDQIVGNNAANRLDGGDGDDTLIGAGGSDLLFGSFGNDIFIYSIGSGADTIDGGGGTDTLQITGTTGTDTLTVAFDGSALTGVAGGSLTGVESVTTNLGGGTDTLSYAGSSAAVTVDLGAASASGFTAIAGIEKETGGSGNDMLTDEAGVSNTLTGGAGDDSYYVHDTGDTVSEISGSGNDTVYAYVNAFTLSANIENLVFAGTGNFTGTGNSAANIIIGGNGVDTLNGGGGDDVIRGGAGTDTMNGGMGNDSFVFAPGFGNDTIYGFDANPTGGQDLLDVRELGITADNFVDRVLIQDIGADMRVTIDGTDTITLAGVTGSGANTITQSDFWLL